ncbi:MAG: DUF554 domain-containing protein [Ruminococcaceae bacterium]|nr:DUF554 domain-containing protein [Oscillospiraceae bacterium]
MIGTLVNTAAVAAGGAIGLLLKKGIRDSWAASVNKALGISIIVVGLCGVVTNMIAVKEGTALGSSGELILIISLVVGTLIGEILRLDDRLDGFAKGLEKRFGSGGGFAAGFVNATLITCVGAMAIVGALQEGLSGNATTLYIKSGLDFVTSMILGATMGAGVIASAAVILVYQGTITLCAGALQGVLQGELLTQICAIGFAIIICIGMNFFVKDRIKTLNMLPAILVPVAWWAIRLLMMGNG